ncbi:hypothetical protein ACFPAG_16700 [Vogesella sp. GCM10023246]|uniref:Uncharacterized protein n=1 Tax=Vogesella oryzagri TaxID=3160864 RepID=A0ABV1M7R3_9NEIS
MQARTLKQLLICFTIFLLLTVMAVFSSSIYLGFFGYVAMLIVGTTTTTIGVVVGDAIRRLAMPDLVFAAGGVDLLRKKVFWLVGPQAIGWFVGYIAFKGVMGKLGFYL